MNLDLIVGSGVGFAALCAFTLSSITEPGRDLWMTWPWYVRWSFNVMGVSFGARSVNLVTLRPAPEIVLGHVNYWSMFATFGLVLAMSTLTVHIASRILREKGWARMRFAETAERENPDLVIAPLAQADVIDIARAKGITVNAGR